MEKRGNEERAGEKKLEGEQEGIIFLKGSNGTSHK